MGLSPLDNSLFSQYRVDQYTTQYSPLCPEGTTTLCPRNATSINVRQSPLLRFTLDFVHWNSPTRSQQSVDHDKYPASFFAAKNSRVPEPTCQNSLHLIYPKMIASHLLWTNLMVGELATGVHLRRQQQTGSCSGPSTPFCCTREKVEPDVESSSTDPYYSYTCELAKPDIQDEQELTVHA